MFQIDDSIPVNGREKLVDTVRFRLSRMRPQIQSEVTVTTDRVILDVKRLYFGVVEGTPTRASIPLQHVVSLDVVNAFMWDRLVVFGSLLNIGLVSLIFMPPMGVISTFGAAIYFLRLFPQTLKISTISRGDITLYASSSDTDQLRRIAFAISTELRSRTRGQSDRGVPDQKDLHATLEKQAKLEEQKLRESTEFVNKASEYFEERFKNR